MTPAKLSNKLREMYEGAASGDSTTMIRLFGIKYAEELKGCGKPMKAIAQQALGNPSYHAEISKGIRLARYVKMK